MATEWSKLPEELLHRISQGLPNIPDFLRFRAVCRSWRSAAGLLDLPKQFWLLLPHNLSSTTRSFFSLTARKIHSFKHRKARGKIVCGSSFGWLFMLDKAHRSPTLLNPITGAQITLPPLASCFPNHRENINALVWDASLSSNPSDPRNVNNCVAVVSRSLSKLLAICRLGDAAAWSMLDTGLTHDVRAFLYHEERIYAVDVMGTGVVLDVRTRARLASIPSPIDASPGALSHTFCHMNRFYLFVRSSEELGLVANYPKAVEDDVSAEDEEDEDGDRREDPSVEEEKVEMFELNLKEELVWRETRNLGDHRALFLSENKSTVVCASASRIAGSDGLREGDCIYFDSPYRGYWKYPEDERHYVNIFSIKEQNFKILSCGQWKKPPGAHQTAGLWVTPCLC